MWLLCALFVLALVLGIIHQTCYFPSLRTFLLFRKLPGPHALPIVGVAAYVALSKPTDALKLMEFYARRYHKLACAYILGVPFVILTDPDYVKVVLSSHQHIGKGVYYSFMKSWLAEGLVTSQGEKWRSRRKLVTSAFHVKNLENNVTNFWKNSRFMVESMLKRNGMPFKVEDFVYPCALDIICETAMSVSLNAQKRQNKSYTDALERTLNGVLFRILNPYLRREWLWGITPIGSQYNKDVKTLQGFTEKVIRERISNYTPSTEADDMGESQYLKGKERQPFLDKLIEVTKKNPETWKISDIQEEVDTIMFAGHDTSSGTTAFAMWMLGHHPEIQEKVYQEMYEIFGDDDRDVTVDDLPKMNYLEMVIKETLRKFPTVPVIIRTLQQDLQLENYLLPEGANVFISPVLLHWDKSVYPNPQKFDPERFTPEECAKRNPFSYIPFSAGPRSCIGQKFAMYELKVLLSTVVRFCEITSVTRQEDVSLIPSVVIRPSVPLEVKLEPRISARRSDNLRCM